MQKWPYIVHIGIMQNILSEHGDSCTVFRIVYGEEEKLIQFLKVHYLFDQTR